MSEPLTFEDLVEAYNSLKPATQEPPGEWIVDERKLVENGIGYFLERPGYFIMSPKGRERAIACGAIRHV